MKAKNTIIVAINFDLDTKKLKDIYVQSTGKKYNHAYYDIKSFMKKNGFSHRQGSGYLKTHYRNICNIYDKKNEYSYAVAKRMC